MNIDDILIKIKEIQGLAQPVVVAASSSSSQVAASSSDNPTDEKLKKLLIDLNEALKQNFQQNEDILKQAKQYTIQLLLGLAFTRHDSIRLKQVVMEVFGEEFRDVIAEPITQVAPYPDAANFPDTYNQTLYNKLYPLCQLGYLLEKNGDAAEHAFKLAVIFDNETIAIDYLINFRDTNSCAYLLHDACLFELPSETECNLKWWLKQANQGRGMHLKMLDRRFREILAFSSNIEQMIQSSQQKLRQQVIDDLKQQPTFSQLDKKMQHKAIRQEISRSNQKQWQQVQQAIKLAKQKMAAFKRANAHWQGSPEERIEQLKKLGLESSESLIALATAFQGLAINRADLYVLLAFYQLYKNEKSPVHHFLATQGISDKNQILFDKLARRDDAREIPDIMIDGSELGIPGYYLRKLDVKSDKGAAIAASLGKMTNCCQWLGGIGHDCAINGIESSHAGFYVMFRGDANQASVDDEVIAQAWAWRGKDDAIVLDSVEADTKADKVQVATMYQVLGHRLVHKPEYPVEVVKTGSQSGVTAKVADTTLSTAKSKFKDYSGYCDSTRQFLLASTSTPYLFLERVANPQFKQILLNDTRQLVIQLLANDAKYSQDIQLQQMVVFACRYSSQLKDELIAKAADYRDEELMALIAVNTQYLDRLDNDVVDMSLIDNGAYFEAKNKSGKSALHIAAQALDMEKISALLARKANIDSYDNEGNTPLLDVMKTVLYQQSNVQAREVIRFLLIKGADVDCSDNKEDTPLIIAIKNNDFEMVKLLIEHGANIELADEYLCTPLFWAVSKGNETIVDYLLTLGAKSNIKAYITDKTLLMAAVESGNYKVIDKVLALNKSSLTESDNKNSTVFHLARNNPDLLLRLISELETEQQKIDCLAQINNDFQAVINWVNLLPTLSQLSSDASVALMEKLKSNLIACDRMDATESYFPFLSPDKLKKSYQEAVTVIPHQELMQITGEMLSDEEFKQLIGKIQIIPNLELDAAHAFDKTLVLIIMNELPKVNKHVFLQKIQQYYQLSHPESRYFSFLSIDEVIHIINEIQDEDKLSTLKLLVGDRVDLDYHTMLTILEILPPGQRVDAMAMANRYGNSLLAQQVFNHLYNMDEKLRRVERLLSILPEEDRIKALRQKVTNGHENIVDFCEVSVDLAKLCLSMLPDKHRVRSLLQKRAFERSYFPFALLNLLSHREGVDVLCELISESDVKKLLRVCNKVGLQHLIETPKTLTKALHLYTQDEQIKLLKEILTNYKQPGEAIELDSEEALFNAMFAEPTMVLGSYFLTYYEANIEVLIDIITHFDNIDTQVEAMLTIFGNQELFKDKILRRDKVEQFFAKLPEQLRERDEANNLHTLCMQSVSQQLPLRASSSSAIFFHNKEDSRSSSAEPAPPIEKKKG